MKNDDFLRAIIAKPDDDAPRLIYADWLDENGASERAEFIRLDVELARLDVDDPTYDVQNARAAQLREQCEQAWRAELPALPEGVAYGYCTRGFIAEVRTNSLAALNEAAPILREAIPLERLDLSITASSPVVAECLLLSQLRVLRLVHEPTAERYTNTMALPTALFPPTQELPYRRLFLVGQISWRDARSLAAARLPHLTHLQLTDTLDESTALLQAPWFAQLQYVRVRPVTGSDSFVRPLIARLSATHLRTLILDASLGDVAARALIQSGLLAQLRYLEIASLHVEQTLLADFFAALPPTLKLTLYNTCCHVNGMPDANATLTMLAQSPALATMAQLPNFGSGIVDEAVQTLANTPYGQRLQSLRLPASISVATCAALLLPERFPKLRILNIMIIRQASTPPLAACRHPQLQQLLLAGHREEVEGLASMCADGEFVALEHLSLMRAGFGPRAAAILGNACGLNALRVLCLSYNPLGEGSLVALLNGCGFPHLEELRVYGCRTTATTLRALWHNPRLAQLKVIHLGQSKRGDWPDDASYAVYCEFRDYAWSLGCSVDGWTGGE